MRFHPSIDVVHALILYTSNTISLKKMNLYSIEWSIMSIVLPSIKHTLIVALLGDNGDVRKLILGILINMIHHNVSDEFSRYYLLDRNPARSTCTYLIPYTSTDPFVYCVHMRDLPWQSYKRYVNIGCRYVRHASSRSVKTDKII
jgi:hypothetical protein